MPLSVELRKGRNKAYWYWRKRGSVDGNSGGGCCLQLLQGGDLQLLQGGCLRPLMCETPPVDCCLELYQGGCLELYQGGELELYSCA